MTKRRLVVGALVWVLVLGVTRTVVALPEHCPPLTADGARAAAAEAVAWFERNQLDDGRWVYRYDRDADEVDRSPHDVRHSGVAMSLYQAAAAGFDDALDVADRGTAWSLDNVVRHDGWQAVTSSSRGARTGATALLVVGLAVRRADTGDPRFDDDLHELGRFLVAMTEPSGAVLEEWDVEEERPTPGAYSIYFTGETLFALSWLATIEPDGGWTAPALRIAHYLASERERAERVYPPLPDHWAAYGLEQLANGVGVELGDEERSYARRLAGLFGISVRYESQRTGDGLNETVLRGGRTLGAGLGTLGEALGALWRLDGDGPTGERLRCAAGMLADRQVDEGSTYERGAWFRDGVTQMDDQQHALSALLASAPAFVEGGGRGGPSGDDGFWRVLWLAVVAAASVGRGPRARESGLVVMLGLALAALLAGPFLRAVDVSPPTALLAAGLVLVGTAVVDLARGRPPDAPWLRPATLFVVVAVAADVGVWPGLLAAVAAGAATAMRRPSARVGVAALAILGAADLVVDGVLGI